MDGWMDGWMDGYTDEWKDRQTNIYYIICESYRIWTGYTTIKTCLFFSTHLHYSKERETHTSNHNAS